MAQDVLGFATKSSKGSPKALASSNGTQKNINQIKKNAGVLADAVGEGDDDSYKQFQQQQQQKQVQQDQQTQQKKQNSLLGKVTKVAKTVGNAAITSERTVATGIARDLPGGMADVNGQQAIADQSQKNIQTYKQLLKQGKISQDKYKRLVANEAGDASQASKTVTDTEKNMPTKGQLAAGFAGTAADILTAGQYGTAVKGAKSLKVIKGAEIAANEEKAAKAASLLSKTQKIKQAAKTEAAYTAGNAAAGGLNAAAGGGSKEDIEKNALAGALLPEALHVGGSVAAKGVTKVASTDAAKTIADKANVIPAALGKDKNLNEFITNAKTNSLLDRMHGDNASLDANTEKSLHTVMTGVHTPKAVTEANAAKVTATKEAAATAEKSATETKKIDQQLEVYQAKKADKGGELTNVDQVKIKQLQDRRAELNPEQATANTDNRPFASLQKQIEEAHNAGNHELATKLEAQLPDQGMNPDAPAMTAERRASLMAKMKKGSTEGSMPKTAAAAPKVPPEAEASTRTLKPSETAHMPEIGGYTHSEHMAQEYADMLRGQEQTVKGGQMVKNADGSYRRISEHSRFYRDFYKEHGKAPTKADYLEQAKKELEAHKDGMGAGADYKKLLEREAKPVERVKVESSVKDVPQGTSRVAKRIEHDLKEQYGDLAQYDRISIADQAKKAEALISDREKLDRVISGQESLPDGLRATSIIAAVRHDPELLKDTDLLKRLASSPLASESSYSAQELRIAAENAKNDPITAIRQINTNRQKAFEKKNGKTVTKAVNDEVRQIQTAKPKVTKETWGSFVDSLKC